MLSRALLIVVGTHAALVSPPTHAQSFGDWTVGAGQGWIEYRVENGPGNSFMIACDEDYSGGQKKTHISVSIRDKSPPAESSAKLFVDGKEFWMGVDANKRFRRIAAHVMPTLTQSGKISEPGAPYWSCLQ